MLILAKLPIKYSLQGQDELFGPSLEDLVPANDPVRIVSAVLDSLDLSDIYASYQGGGAAAYDPLMMLKIIVYGYLCNVYSGRQLARLIKRDVNFMWLTHYEAPDFRTLNYFRSVRLADGAFDRIFTQVVMLLNERGVVSLEQQFIDGTKLESVANRYTFVWRGTVEKNKAKLEQRLSAVLKHAREAVGQEADAKENQTEFTPEEVKETIADLKEKLAQKPIQTQEEKDLVKTLKHFEKDAPERLTKYNKSLEIMGKRNSYSKTDHDATFMRLKEDAMKNGQTKPAYNIQIATNGQFVTNYGIYQKPTDQGTLIKFVNSYHARYGTYGSEVIADSGYGSEQNYQYLFDTIKVTPYVKYNMFHINLSKAFQKRIFHIDNMPYCSEGNYYTCPNARKLLFWQSRETISDLGFKSIISIYRCEDCSGCPYAYKCRKGDGNRTVQVNFRNNKYRAKAKELLTSETGLKRRGQRYIEPEAVFGDIKHNHGFKRFKLKGQEKVGIEFGLAALAHNLRKFIRIVTGEICPETVKMAA